MPKLADIEKWKEHYSHMTDAEVLSEKNQWNHTTEMHIAAVQILRDREQKTLQARHNEIISQLNKKHWTVLPSFWLLVISVLLGAVALYTVLGHKLF